MMISSTVSSLSLLVRCAFRSGSATTLCNMLPKRCRTRWNGPPQQLDRDFRFELEKLLHNLPRNSRVWHENTLAGADMRSGAAPVAPSATTLARGQRYRAASCAMRLHLAFAIIHRCIPLLRRARTKASTASRCFCAPAALNLSSAFQFG